MNYLLFSSNFELYLLRPFIKEKEFANLHTKIDFMKSLFYYISIFCVLVFMNSCSKKQIKTQELTVFRYNESANIQTLDPAFARNQAIIWPCNQIFNSLVLLDDELNVKPDVAKSWEISEDGKTYEFIIRNDVYFHKHSNFGKDSTRVVVASDFEYSFKRLISEQLASPGAWIFQYVDDFKALNDSVFQIKLQKPFPAFLGLLSMKYASVVPKEIIEDKNIDFRTNPIGTGPFQFKIWEENIKLVLRKNTLYFEKDDQGNQLPYLDAVAINFLPDKQSAFLQFIQGNLDFINGLDPSYKDDLLNAKGELQPKYENKIKLLTGPYLNSEYLGFRLDGTDEVVKDKRIRQALNIGFDRHKLLVYLRNGMGSAKVKGIIPEGLVGYNDANLVVYDLVNAKALVADYIKEKKQKPRIMLSTNSTYVDIAEYLQREWLKIGIDVQVDVSPPSTLRQSMATGKVSFFRGSWIADYPDAENYLSLFSSNNFAPNGPNYTHFKNERFDRLYKESFTETDIEKRKLLYEQMDEIIQEEVPVIVLFYDKVVRFTHNNISGLNTHPMNLLTLKKVKKINN